MKLEKPWKSPVTWGDFFPLHNDLLFDTQNEMQKCDLSSLQFNLQLVILEIYKVKKRRSPI